MPWISDEFKDIATTVTTSATTVLEGELHDTDVSGKYQLGSVTVTNTGAVALAAYIIQVKFHQDDEWYTIISDTDFNTLGKRLLFVSTTRPHELAASGVAVFEMDVRNIYRWRHRATAASTTTTVTVRGTLGFSG